MSGLKLLQEMWSRQNDYNKKHIDITSASKVEKLEFVKEMVLGIHSELDELLTAAGNWKKHRHELSPTSRSGVLEECIDISKYLLNIMLTYDIRPAEFIAEFHQKSTVVESRYEWETELAAMVDASNVVAIDLDGVLAKYPENWIEFLSARLDEKFDMSGFSEGVSFPDIPRNLYYKLKHEFRDEGYESAKVKPFKHVAKFTKALRDAGCKIVILSSRPYKQYKRIQTDTTHWLLEHDIAFDAFIWDSAKREQVLCRAPKLKFLIEDSKIVAEDIASMGYKVYLVDRPYNRGVLFSQHVIRVKNLMEILSKEGIEA